MGIEARGARCPYLAVVTAIAVQRDFGGIRNHIHVSRAFLAADSEDEAYGIATKIGERCFPSANGWESRWIMLVPLAGIDWIGRHDLERDEPVSRPW